MTELHIQNIMAAIEGKPFDLDLLMTADLAVVVGERVLVPRSTKLGDVRQFQLMVAQMLDHDMVTVIECGAHVVQQATSEPTQESAAPAPEPGPEAPKEEQPPVKMPENVRRELGTPQAAAERSDYNSDLPQCMEFLRPTLKVLRDAGCSEPIIQLLLKSALEAKDMGVLGDWGKLVVEGVAKTLKAPKKRTPDEFVPAMVKFVSDKLSERYADLDSDIQRVIRLIGARVPEAHKGRFLEYVDLSIKEDKAKFFVAAYDELIATEDSGRSVAAPWRFWVSIIDNKMSQEKVDKLRQPIKVEIKDAVEWIKPWLPTYDPTKLDQANISEFQPLTKRTTRERQVEACYFRLREDVIKKGNGASLDALVEAWTSPDAAELQSLWVNTLEKVYTEDGKRYAFSAQHFGIIATAFFLDVFRRKGCEAWVDANRDALKHHPKIAALYAQVFPAPTEEPAE